MNKKLFRISFQIAFLVMMFSACNDDNDLSPQDSSSSESTNSKTTAVFNPEVTYGTLTDQDGNVYKTVTIGTQTWMAENLRTKKYNDGSAISYVTVESEWNTLNSGAYCNYNNGTNSDTIATYGRLYNWHAINTGKLAPTGWHVPAYAEWQTLANYLGGILSAGGKLKENGTTHWASPNIGATNETGFTALPGGLGRPFGNIGLIGYWWSASEDNILTYKAVYVSMSISQNSVYSNNTSKSQGLSVRCVKD